MELRTLVRWPRRWARRRGLLMPTGQVSQVTWGQAESDARQPPQVETTQVEATQVEAAQVEAAQVEAAEFQAVQAEAAGAEAAAVEPREAARDQVAQDANADAEVLDGPLYTRSPTDPRPLVPQPVIAMRARTHLAMISGGLVLAIIGAICVVLSSVTMLRLTDTSPILPALGNFAAVLNALVALMQWRLWRLALKEWEGIKDVDIHAWLGVSASGTWLAVIGAAAVSVSSWMMLEVTARSETSWWLAMVGSICVILGAATAGVHRFRPEGPRGVPAHIRRNQEQHAARRSVVTTTAAPGNGSRRCARCR